MQWTKIELSLFFTNLDMESIIVWIAEDIPSDFRELCISAGLNVTQDPNYAEVHLVYVDEKFSDSSFDYNVVKVCKAKNIIALVSSNGHRKYIPDGLEYQTVYNLRSKKKVQDLLTSLSQNCWASKPISKRQKGKLEKNKKRTNTIAEVEQMKREAAAHLAESKKEQERILAEANQRKQEIINEGHVEATPDDLLCNICCEKPKNAMFLHGNTSHQFACYECSIQCEDCPVCRAKYDRVYKIFDV